MTEIQTWTDHVGIYYASVPLSGSQRLDALDASNAIAAAMLSDGYAGRASRLRVTRDHVTNHGTVTYREDRHH